MTKYVDYSDIRFGLYSSCVGLFYSSYVCNLHPFQAPHFVRCLSNTEHWGLTVYYDDYRLHANHKKQVKHIFDPLQVIM